MYSRNTRITTRFGAAVALMAVSLLCSSTAWADIGTITYTLTTGNSAISPYPQPYGSVLVDLLDSTHATFTFTADSNANYVYSFMTNGSVAVNLNASKWTLGSISGTPAAWATYSTKPPQFTDGKSGNEDGFGSFNQTIDSFDGFGSASQEITFDVTNTGGTWTTADSVLAVNSNNALVAAHIGVCQVGKCDTTDGALATGYAAGNAGGTISEVPEPAMISALSGLGGLLVLVAARVRRRARV